MCIRDRVSTQSTWGKYILFISSIMRANFALILIISALTIGDSLQRCVHYFEGVKYDLRGLVKEEDPDFKVSIPSSKNDAKIVFRICPAVLKTNCSSNDTSIPDLGLEEKGTCKPINTANPPSAFVLEPTKQDNSSSISLSYNVNFNESGQTFSDVTIYLHCNKSIEGLAELTTTFIGSRIIIRGQSNKGCSQPFDRYVSNRARVIGLGFWRYVLGVIFALSGLALMLGATVNATDGAVWFAWMVTWWVFLPKIGWGWVFLIGWVSAAAAFFVSACHRLIQCSLRGAVMGLFIAEAILRLFGTSGINPWLLYGSNSAVGAAICCLLPGLSRVFGDALIGGGVLALGIYYLTLFAKYWNAIILGIALVAGGLIRRGPVERRIEYENSTIGGSDLSNVIAKAQADAANQPAGGIQVTARMQDC
eukprot:TRINITY_DN1642_c0_g1_i1.p1 TRINITY_DN1642_c0_g1~~TRINITY_DN1642_c0_g1_i1.p1  ORF type:complete len:421 (+),score=77.63 TRINITY_DN1642_c0_g1_i1:65-1327(+)